MISLTHIDPKDLSPKDKINLVRCAKADYNRRSAVDLLRLVLEGQLALWRMEGEAEGLVLLRVMETLKGRMLQVESAAGEGQIIAAPLFCDALFRLARQLDCKFLTGVVTRKGVMKALEANDLPIVAHIFLKEIPDA